MAVKFSEFTIGTINADLEIVGFNSATPANVQVSYTDIKTDILAGAITGTVAIGQVAFGTATNTIGGSNAAIISLTDVATLTLNPVGAVQGNFIRINNPSGYNYIGTDGSGGFGFGNGNFILNTLTAGTSVVIGTQNVSRFQVSTTTGNVILQNGGTFTDGGQRLQVYGDTFLKGSDTSPSTGALTIQNSGGIDLFKVFNNGQIYIPQPSSTVLYLNQIAGYSTDRIGFGRFISGGGISGMNASAHVEIVSTTQGFLGPRMTNAQRVAIASPANGLLVHCTDATEGLYQYINNAWVNITGIVTNRQTASYTLALGDANDLVEMNVATANSLTVPLDSAVAFPVGTKIDISQYGAGQTTVVATGGVTIRSAGGALKLAAQYSGGSLVKIATNEWYLFGDITV